MGKLKINEQEISKSLSLFKPDNELFEIRLHSTESNKVMSGYFNDINKCVEALKKLSISENFNVFFTLNELNPDCYSRKQRDRFISYAKPTTSDKDIIKYKWLLIDLDPERTKGVSSNKTELDRAFKKMKVVYDYLKTHNWHDPILAQSGNGYHLLYKIDLDVSQKELISNLLKTLNNLFSDNDVKIDTSVFNPSRICKLYGTTAVKGVDSAERPHRLAKIIKSPDTVNTNDISVFNSILFETQKEHQVKRETTHNKRNNFKKSTFDLEQWFVEHNIDVLQSETYNGGIKYILTECPFDNSHKGKDAAVIQQADGTLCFHCFHDSCSDKGWKDFRSLFEPDYYKNSHKHKNTKEAPLYFIKSGNSYTVSKPLLAEYIRNNCHYFLVESRRKTKVFWYDSGVYKLVNDNMLQGYIKKYITDFDISLLKMRDVKEVAEDIKTDLNFIDESTLNSNENIINFKNGLYSLSEDKLYPHTPNEYTTIQLPCNYNPGNTNAPVFEKFIDTLCEGDEQKKKFLLEYMGIAISNIYGYRMKKALFMYGKGDTGKTQPKTLIERLLGTENFAVCDLKQLESRWGASNLYCKRLVGCGDTSFMTVSELKMFKNATGGDSISLEFKGDDIMKYTYTGLFWYCMNELPAFGGDKGQWVYDRIVAFDCNNVIPQHKRDPKLCDKMYAEREAIINLLIPAINRVIKAGYNFSVPDKCKTNTQQYMDDNSPIRTFVKECCVLTERKVHKHRTAELFQVFKEWYRDNVSSIVTYSNQKFKKELAQILNYDINEVKFKYNGNEYFVISLTEQAEKCYFPYGFNGM